MKGGKNALVWKVFGGTQRDLLLSLAGLRGSDQVDEDGKGFIQAVCNHIADMGECDRKVI